MAPMAFLDKFSPGRAGPRDELTHVLRNLEAILNTKEGYGWFVKGFGLGDYAERRGTRALVETLTAEIRREVERYEPRLSEVEVKPRGQDGALWLHFDLHASFSHRPLALRLLFDTVSGQVRVQRGE